MQTILIEAIDYDTQVLGKFWCKGAQEALETAHWLLRSESLPGPLSGLHWVGVSKPESGRRKAFRAFNWIRER